MGQVRIYSEGYELDIVSSDRLPLSVSRTVDEAKDLSKRGGDKTATFSLPYTSNNVRFFGDLAAPAGIKKFNRALSFKIDVFVDGVAIFKSALLRVTQVSREGGFQCFAVSSNINFAETFKERRLRDLPLRTIPFKSGLDVIAINALVDTTDPAVYEHPELYDCVFPLTAYNRFFIPNRWARGYQISQKAYVSNSAGFDPSGQIALPVGQEILDQNIWDLGRNDLDGNANLSYYSYPPAPYICSVVKKMFEQLGFVATGRWLEDPEVRKLISLFTATSGQLPAWNWGTLAEGVITSDGSGLGEFTDLTYYELQELIPATLAAVFFHLTDNVAISPRVIEQDRGDSFRYLPAYTAPAAGRYSIAVNLDGQFVTDNSPTPYKRYVVAIRETASAESNALQADILSGKFVTDFASAPDLLFNSEFVSVIGELPTGLGAFSFTGTGQIDVNIYEKIHVMFVLTAGSGVATYADSLTNLSVTIENISADVDLQPARFLPDISQSEFLLSMVDAFNLYINIDPVAGVVHIDNYPNFYEPNDLALELECDPNSVVISPIESARTYTFDWENDEQDYPLKSTGGALQFREIVDNETIYGRGNSGATLAPFAPTIFETYTIVDDTANDFLNPTFTPTAEITLPSLVTNEADLRPQNDWVNFTPPSGFKPRIVKVKELVTLPAGAWVNLRVWDDTLAPNLRDKFVQQNQYVRCIFDDTDTPPTPPLFWTLNWKGQHGLYRKNYESQILLYQWSHLMGCDVRLTPVQFWQLTLRKKVRLGMDVYYLQKLSNFNPENPTTVKLELIKVL